MDNFKRVSNLANVGDSKTLAIHPWTTTQEWLSDWKEKASGDTEVRYFVPLLLSNTDLVYRASSVSRSV